MKEPQTCPVHSETTQTPLTHWPDGQMLPHAPQLLGSVRRFAPPQLGVGETELLTVVGVCLCNV
jgi:hypothetical protein